jgi:hypothetical protein
LCIVPLVKHAGHMATLILSSCSNPNRLSASIESNIIAVLPIFIHCPPKFSGRSLDLSRKQRMRVVTLLQISRRSHSHLCNLVNTPASESLGVYGHVSLILPLTHHMKSHRDAQRGGSGCALRMATPLSAVLGERYARRMANLR